MSSDLQTLLWRVPRNGRAGIFTGRLASHNPPAWGPSVRDLDIMVIQRTGGSYRPYYVSNSYPCRVAACLYLYKQY